MKLVVIIPALNEEKTIKEAILRVPKNLEKIDSVEIIVIDDGSKDQTAKIAQEAGASVISHKKNRGVGIAFQTGILEALKHGADLIAQMDADLQFSPEDIPLLLKPILEGKAEFVTCSRFKDKKFTPKMPLLKYLGNQALVKIVNFIVKGKYTDVSCGFRAFTKNVACKLNLYGEFTYTQETFIDLASKNISIAEVPLKVRGQRKFGKSRIASNLFSYAFKSFLILVKAFRDYKPFKMFGSAGAFLIFLGVVSGIFVFGHWLRTGATFPYRSVVTLSSVLLILGFLVLILALIADMLGRQRRIQEEILYYQKKRIYK